MTGKEISLAMFSPVSAVKRAYYTVFIDCLKHHILFDIAHKSHPRFLTNPWSRLI